MDRKLLTKWNKKNFINISWVNGNVPPLGGRFSNYHKLTQLTTGGLCPKYLFSHWRQMVIYPHLKAIIENL